MTKTHSIAMLAAILAQHYRPKKLSAYSAAECAAEMTSAANSIVDLETFHCNGFKTEWHEKEFARLGRANDTAGANALQAKTWENGSAYYEKRKAALSKKVQRIAEKHELPREDFKICGLYGGVRFIADGRNFNIACK